MKRNTKLLLLSCFYSPESSQETRWRGYEFFYDLFSDLTEGGVRSIIFDLVKKGYLKRFYVNGKSFFEITATGISKLTLLFPGVKMGSRKKAEGEGHILIFISSPKHDVNFQSLRNKLKHHFFVQLTKGVYYSSLFTLPAEIFELLLNKYSSSVVLLTVKSFSLAFPDSENNPLTVKNNLKKTLSETSSRFDRMIDSSVENKNISYQLKMSVSSSFKNLSVVLETHQNLLLEDRQLQELFFQAYFKWTILVSKVYFSRKIV